jgi:predicted O-methyltransferase YrrM
VSLEFCQTLNDLYRTGNAVDSTGVTRSPGGLSTCNNLLIIRSLMLSRKPTQTLEVGLAAGGSALTFASSHRDIGAAPSHQHVAIDPYQRVWHHLGVTLLERAGLSEFVEIFHEPSRLALPTLLRSGRQFQLAYIDGSHAFHEAMLDFYYVRHLLSPGGIVLFDDCASSGVRRLIKCIRADIVSFREFDLRLFRPAGSSKIRYAVARTLNKVQCLAFQKHSDPEDDESWQWK